MNNIDKQYQALLQDILDNGVQKKDRTGTGTLSVFGRQIRHKMSEGFPLLTTKKMHWKSIVVELLWFLRGDTNIKYLVDNDCHIWVGDAWANYSKKIIANNLQLIPAVDLPKNKEEFIDKIKTDDEFAKEWGNLGPIYGKQWRSWKNKLDRSFKTRDEWIGKEDSIDQISNAIQQLKTNPDDRGIIVSAWNVGELQDMVLRPCHNFFQFYTRELSEKERYEWVENNIKSYIKSKGLDYDLLTGNLSLGSVKLALYKESPTRAISLMWNQRSVDTFLGLPFNIASYALLLEIVAKEVNMVPDELIGNLGDTHLYLNHVEQAKEQISRTPFELPSISIDNVLCGSYGSGPIQSWECYRFEHFHLQNYQSHPAIKAPLNN